MPVHQSTGSTEATLEGRGELRCPEHSARDHTHRREVLAAVSTAGSHRLSSGKELAVVAVDLTSKNNQSVADLLPWIRPQELPKDE